jgi:hypothetical protein
MSRKAEIQSGEKEGTLQVSKQRNEMPAAPL